MNMHITSWEPFLFGVASGEINSNSVERVLKLTASIAARKRIAKVLIDGRLVSGTLTTAEREALATRITEYVNKTGSSPNVAFVGHPPTFNGLGVLAARNRGLNIMLFADSSDAIAWLRLGHISKKGIRAASAYSSARNAHPH